jgi:hypothetical protein
MIEVFAGGAVLTSIAKHSGLGGIAIDKTRKPNARCTIFQLDLLKEEDRELLEDWLQSPLLLCVHFAPVCGTASKAREIPRADVPFAPLPLRSCDFPHGLPSLSGIELKRVELANELFRYTCHLFLVCTAWKVGHNGKPKGFLFLANRLCFGVDAESPALRQ